MTPDLDPTGPEQRVSEERERALALAEVLRDQAERAQVAREAEARMASRGRLRRGVLAVLWVAVAWVWVANPGWTRVTPPPAPPLEADLRALRTNVFLQAQQVEAFRRARGRLPWVLEEVGPPLPGMEYRRRDNRRYEIQARSRRAQVTWASDRAQPEVVRAAGEMLAPRREAQARRALDPLDPLDRAATLALRAGTGPGEGPERGAPR